MRVRTIPTSLIARGTQSSESNSHGVIPPGEPEHGRCQECEREHRGVEGTGALAAESDRECLLACAPVGLQVAHVVDDQDRACDQADGYCACECLPGQFLNLHEVGARDRHDAEEQEHEHLAEALVAVGARAAGVEHAGEDRGGADGDQLGARDVDQVDATEHRKAEGDVGRKQNLAWRTRPPAVTRTGPRRSSVSAPLRASE